MRVVLVIGRKVGEKGKIVLKDAELFIDTTCAQVFARVPTSLDADAQVSRATIRSSSSFFQATACLYTCDTLLIFPDTSKMKEYRERTKSRSQVNYTSSWVGTVRRINLLGACIGIHTVPTRVSNLASEPTRTRKVLGDRRTRQNRAVSVVWLRVSYSRSLFSGIVTRCANRVSSYNDLAPKDDLAPRDRFHLVFPPDSTSEFHLKFVGHFAFVDKCHRQTTLFLYTRIKLVNVGNVWTYDGRGLYETRWKYCSFNSTFAWLNATHRGCTSFPLYSATPPQLKNHRNISLRCPFHPNTPAGHCSKHR